MRVWVLLRRSLTALHRLRRLAGKPGPLAPALGTANPRHHRSRQTGFTLVEILLALLVLSVGLLGVLALFPVGIDSARRAVESTRSATIARMAKSILLTNNDAGRSPFDRIVNDVSTGAYYGPWFLPHFDETYDPAADGNSTVDGPLVERVALPGEDPNLADYSWSITVAYPYDFGTSPPYDYVLNDLRLNQHVFIVQVAVYRKFAVTEATGNVVSLDRSGPSSGWTSMIINGLPSSLSRSFGSGDHLRYLYYDTAASQYVGDGFWYEIDQIAGDTVKLSEGYWGVDPGASADLQFTDRIIGTYTFVLSEH